jgi:outer membrane protein assembly factor BamB
MRSMTPFWLAATRSGARTSHPLQPGRARLRLAANRGVGVACVALLALTTDARAEDWTGWLGPHRDNSTTEKIAVWKDPPKLLWKVPAGEGNGSPIVADGKVFVHSKVAKKNLERVEAFDAKTGAPLWDKTYERPAFTSLYGNGPRATPAYSAGKVYTHGITGLVTCFDAKDGTQLWQVDTHKDYKVKNLFFGVSASPIVDGDRLYLPVGGVGASVVAFDKNTGKEVWKSGDDKASYASPNLVTVDGKKQLLVLTAAHLIGLDLLDGKEVWTHPFLDKISESSTTPVKADDLVIGSAITLGTVGLKLDGNATKAWMQPELTSYFSTPVLAGKNLYIAAAKKDGFKFTTNLHCLDLADGKTLWKHDKVGKYNACLTRTGDGKMLLLEEEGALALFEPDPKEYRELCRAKVSGETWSHPAVADGRLYVRDKQEVRCLEFAK